MKTIRCLALASLVLIPWLSLHAQESAPKPASSTPRNITIDDYFQIRDVSQPELSPDGQWVAYAVRTRMLKEDKNEQRLWMVSTHGGDPISMTAEGVSSSHPRWSPDVKYLAFLSSRNNGKTQVWLLNRFFCSSRRRHTISTRDWSSDVCSSDLSGKASGLATKRFGSTSRHPPRLCRSFAPIRR